MNRDSGKLEGLAPLAPPSGRRLPFVPDANGVCLLTGLTALSAGQAKSGHDQNVSSFLNFQNDLSDFDNFRHKWCIDGIEPNVGPRQGFQLVTIKGSFPITEDTSSVYVSFGSVSQRPTRCTASVIQCFTPPVSRRVNSVEVSVTFDNGQVFISGVNPSNVFTFNESSLIQLDKPGSHVFHWGHVPVLLDSGGEPPSPRSAKKDLEGSTPHWFENKYPSLRAGQQLLLGAYLRKYLDVSDHQALSAYLDRFANNGFQVMQEIAADLRKQNLAASKASWTNSRIQAHGGNQQVCNSVREQLSSFRTKGMPIRAIACSNSNFLVLLEDGRMVVQLPTGHPSASFDSWMTLDNHSTLTVLEGQDANTPVMDDEEAQIKTGTQRLLRKRNRKGPQAPVPRLEDRFALVMLPTSQASVEESLRPNMSAHANNANKFASTDPLDERAPDQSAKELQWFFTGKTRNVGPQGGKCAPANVFPQIQRVQYVAAGANHFGAVTDDIAGGHLYMWGDNSSGQLGINSPASFVFKPTKVNFSGLDFDRDFKPCKRLSCGPNSTICVTMDKLGTTSLYSWGAPVEAASTNFRDKVMRATAPQPLVGAYPHMSSQSEPFKALDITPASSSSNHVLWSDALEQWLLAIEEDWSATQGKSHHSGDDDSQERVQHLHQLTNVLSLLLKMKLAYAEDLERAMNFDTATDVGDNDGGMDGDVAESELEGLVGSINDSIELLDANLDEIRSGQLASTTALRAAQLALHDKERQVESRSQELAKTLALVNQERERRLAAQVEGGKIGPTSDTMLDTDGSRDGSDPTSLQNSRSNSSSVKDRRRKSFMPFSRPKNRTNSKAGVAKEKRRVSFWAMGRARKLQGDESNNELNSQLTLTQSDLAELEQISRGQSDRDEEEADGAGTSLLRNEQACAALQAEIEELKAEIHKIKDEQKDIKQELEQARLLANDLLVGLQTMEVSKTLFCDLLADWRMDANTIPRTDHATEDDFDVILALLADAQSCSVGKLAERVKSAAMRSTMPGSAGPRGAAADLNSSRLFSQPGAFVRESLPDEPDELPEGAPSAEPRGLLQLADCLQTRVAAITAALDVFHEGQGESPTLPAQAARHSDPATSALLELTSDLCALKQIHLFGLQSLASETERLLSVGLATSFASADFSDVPRMRAGFKDVASILG